MDVLEENEVFINTSKVKEKDTGDVNKFLNRILGLHVHKQQLVRKHRFLMICMLVL